MKIVVHRLVHVDVAEAMEFYEQKVVAGSPQTSSTNMSESLTRSVTVQTLLRSQEECRVELTLSDFHPRSLHDPD